MANNKWFESLRSPAAAAARRVRNQPLVEEYKSKTPCEFCGIADQNTKFHTKPGKKKFARWNDCSVEMLYIQFDLHFLFHSSCYQKHQLAEAERDRQFKLGIINDGIKMYLLGESPRVPSFIFIPYSDRRLKIGSTRSKGTNTGDQPAKTVEEALRGL